MFSVTLANLHKVSIGCSVRNTINSDQVIAFKLTIVVVAKKIQFLRAVVQVYTCICPQVFTVTQRTIYTTIRAAVFILFGFNVNNS
ncbi:hypothetical protein D3C85_987400 [compost metagenome]